MTDVNLIKLYKNIEIGKEKDKARNDKIIEK
jgi:hypothetical protein